MERLASSPGFRADFVETRHLSLLDAPLESRGTLYFLPQNQMARHVEHPEPAVMIASGSVVHMRDSYGTETLDLSGYPAAKRLIEQFSVTLRGDLRALRERYEVEFELEERRWVLKLKPRSVLLKKLIASIRLAGEGETLDSMVTVDSSGDRTDTRFRNVRAHYAFGSEERDRVFSLEP